MATKKSLDDVLDTPEDDTSKKPTARRGGGRRTPAAEKEPPAADVPEQPEPLRVLTPKADEAKRAGLYLHADDYRALGLAKLDDGADYNARIRAMIAVWRHNKRFRATVDRLARTAPRGPYSGRS